MPAAQLWLNAMKNDKIKARAAEKQFYEMLKRWEMTSPAMVKSWNTCLTQTALPKKEKYTWKCAAVVTGVHQPILKCSAPNISQHNISTSNRLPFCSTSDSHWNLYQQRKYVLLKSVQMCYLLRGHHFRTRQEVRLYVSSLPYWEKWGETAWDKILKNYK